MNTKVWYWPYFEGVYDTRMQMQVWYIWLILWFGGHLGNRGSRANNIDHLFSAIDFAIYHVIVYNKQEVWQQNLLVFDPSPNLVPTSSLGFSHLKNLFALSLPLLMFPKHLRIANNIYVCVCILKSTPSYCCWHLSIVQT